MIVRVSGRQVKVFSRALGLALTLTVVVGLGIMGLSGYSQPSSTPEEGVSTRVYSAPVKTETKAEAASEPKSHPNQTGTLARADIQVPATVKQGQVLKVQVLDTTYFVRNVTPSNGHVTMAGRKAPFFQQPNGTFVALLAVPVFQKPGAYPLNIVDPNGRTLHTLSVTVQDGKYRTQNVSVSKGTAGLQPEPGELETVQRLKDTLTLVRHWDEPFISPTPDCQNSPFGVKRYHNGKATGDYHKGVDLRSPAGRPIKATAGGKVQIARMYRLHGGTVGIDHGQGVGSIYIHMSKIAVKPGDLVKKGDVVGYVGSTGFASGPHLHWGLYVNGLPVEPNQWVKGVPSCG